MSEKFTFFWSGPFSQWYPSEFMIDGRTFNCAEQFMMWSKARFFNDSITAEKIMLTRKPKEQKALGREVVGFNNEDWDANAREFVYIGNMNKYKQNPKLMEKLLATEGTTLVEASPYDKIWGIGLREGDVRSLKRETWEGTNWLGETLTRLRDDFIGEEND